MTPEMVMDLAYKGMRDEHGRGRARVVRDAVLSACW
jgi:hypothetical protein